MGFQDREYFREDHGRGFRLALPQSVVTNLIIVNAVLFAVSWFTASGRFGEDSAVANWLQLELSLIDRPWQFWRLLTYGFMHGGVWHLFWNMYGLFLFGRDVEERYGRWEFLRLYLVLVVCCGLVWLGGNYLVASAMDISRAQMAPVVGASGAVVGVTILFCLNFPRRELLLLAVLPVQAWVLGLLYVLVDLAGALSNIMGGGGRVAHDVHLAGALFAAVYFWFGWRLGSLWPFQGGGIRRWLARKPRLKVLREADDTDYSAPAGGAKDSPRTDLDRRADEILQKLHDQGEASLTTKERRILEDYSRRMRQKHR